MKSILLSIVIPCYNEEESIPLVLSRFDQVISGDGIEVILVNNGSTDGSAEVLRELLPRYPFAKTTLVPINRGYGYGILQGLKEATGTYIGWTHADMQTDPADVVKAADIILEKNSNNLYLKGNRKGRSMFDLFFTLGMSAFESLYLHEKLFDINAQPNIFPRRFYEGWKNPPHDFSLDLYALYMARKYKLEIVRFNVRFPKRLHGQSKWNTGLKSKCRFIKRTVNFSKRLKREGIK